MRKIHFLFSLVFLILIHCSSEEDKGLFPGIKMTGNPFTDALLLGVLGTPPCQFITSENSNTSLVLGEGSTSICSTQAVNGKLRVTATGTYEIHAFPGKQTLSASRCNSMYFDFHIALKEGNTDIYSSATQTSSQVVLEVGKEYHLVPSGLVDPNAYQCQGRTVSSSITPYRMNLSKR